MSEDPIAKSQIGARMSRKDILPKHQGRGQIYTNRDYSANFKSFFSRATFVVCCAVPYAAAAAYMYFTADKVLAIFILVVPLAIGLAFWLLFNLISR